MVMAGRHQRLHLASNQRLLCFRGTVASEALHIQPGVVIPGSELESGFTIQWAWWARCQNHSRITLRWHLDSSTALSERQRVYLRSRIANRITNAAMWCERAHRQQRRNIRCQTAVARAIYTGLQRPKKTPDPAIAPHRRR